MSLTKYNQKRSFAKTPEPKGTLRKKGKALHFVVQKHHASRLHYDFRLEMDGVLKSWAVPKGPSLNPADKHLAMMVEDHPYDYRSFEGIIPEGNYGAGSVIIWDQGTYESLLPVPDGKSEEDFLLEQLENGSIKIIMHGQRLKGEFALVRFKRAGDNGWLLIKHNDEYASKSDILEKDTSVKSGLTLEEMAEGKGVTKKQRQKTIDREEKKEQKVEKTVAKVVHTEGTKARMPHEVHPMLAQLADTPFDSHDWIYEIKWDGYRAVAEVQKGSVSLYSRNHQDFNKKFPEVVSALEQIDHDIVLDGEVVVLDENGKSQFQLLQDYGRSKKGILHYYVFDLLYLDGYDLRDVPLIERKELLEKLLHENDILKYSNHIEQHGLKLYTIAKRKGFEGIMAKRKASRYSSARTTDWLKIKNIQMQEAVICGFTQPRGKRQAFGALILGIYENNELRYVGHAGGGFNKDKLQEVSALLEPLITDSSPFPAEPVANSKPTWVKPKLVCQVKFSEWTNDGLMRQPVFLGMREDKDPKEVTDERIYSGNKAVHHAGSRSIPVKRGKAELTNLNKVFWPKEGYTKGDLIEYYDSVAQTILPYLKDRPISLNRFPNGIEGEQFFQKDLVHKPDWVKTVPIYSESNKADIHWLICNDKDTLLYLANLGSIEINPWNSRYTNPEHPDYVIIDLDPEGIPFKEVVKTAKMVKALFDELELDAFLKTSGKTGLHILLPLKAKYTYDQAKQFAQIIANKVFAKLPEITSVVRNPKKREHKIYVDFLQNREGQTIAAPYCVRPVSGATVSTPLEWDELTSDLSPADFTIKNISRRLKKKGDIWKPLLKHKGIHMLKALKKLS